ncbi:MAG: tRNA methyl transferase PRC-barrel domain-containing protein, partial [Ilumatobacteraceae bacterium]
VCFITHTGGRAQFLGSRIPFRKGTVVDTDGKPLAALDALELVTIGQRRGLGLPGGGPKRYVVDIDHVSATVTVGDESLLDCATTSVHSLVWADHPVSGEVLVQCSAHGSAQPAVLAEGLVRWHRPQRIVAPGQSVVFYDTTDSYVLGGGVAG